MRNRFVSYIIIIISNSNSRKGRTTVIAANCIRVKKLVNSRQKWLAITHKIGKNCWLSLITRCPITRNANTKIGTDYDSIAYTHAFEHLALDWRSYIVACKT
jgi:hypothetical protein